MSPMRDDVQAAQSAWDNALSQKDDFQGEDFPDGDYTVRLTKAERGQSQKGRDQIHLVWTILEGEFRGKEKHSWQGLDTEQSMVFAVRTITRLGFVPPRSLAGVEDVCAQMTEERPVAIIRLKTNESDRGTFQNIYVQRTVAYAGVDDTPASSGSSYEDLTGKTVEFEDESGETVQGEVVEQDGETLGVKVGTDVYDVLFSDASVVTPAPKRSTRRSTKKTATTKKKAASKSKAKSKAKSSR